MARPVRVQAAPGRAWRSTAGVPGSGWGRTIDAVSLYDVLGAKPDASAEELRRAFVAKARRYHPDRHVGADPSARREAERRMSEITEAWSVLSDPQRRRHYDLGLGDPVARGGRGRAPGSPGPSDSSRPSGATGAASPGGGTGRSTPAGSRPATGEAGRHWRSYASPGAGTDSSRGAGEQLLLLSPVLLLFSAGLLGMGGAIIGWPPFYAAALVCLILAAAAFFMLPIWAMTRGRSQRGRGGRGPKRSY